MNEWSKAEGENWRQGEWVELIVPEPANATSIFGPLHIPFGGLRWLVDTILLEHKLASLAREMAPMIEGGSDRQEKFNWLERFRELVPLQHSVDGNQESPTDATDDTAISPSCICESELGETFGFPGSATTPGTWHRPECPLFGPHEDSKEEMSHE